jgi:hypothetical protein
VTISRTRYLEVPPSKLVGSTWQGQVCHTEEGVVMLQTELDKVAALVVGDGGQVGRVHRVGVRQSVVGRWEGAWYVVQGGGH